FFSYESPAFEVVTEDGLLRPGVGRMRPGAVYVGGSARQVERSLGLSGDEILYVGDHMFGDVWISKSVLRWRTALILRELEEEINHTYEFHVRERELAGLMSEKEALEAESCQAKIMLQRAREGYGRKPAESEGHYQVRMNELRAKLEALD